MKIPHEWMPLPEPYFVALEFDPEPYAKQVILGESAEYKENEKAYTLSFPSSESLEELIDGIRDKRIYMCSNHWPLFQETKTKKYYLRYVIIGD
jgi:hypothetical protein